MGGKRSFGSATHVLNASHCLHRSARLIPEDDQIFTEVELNMLDKVINETMVNGF